MIREFLRQHPRIVKFKFNQEVETFTKQIATKNIKLELEKTGKYVFIVEQGDTPSYFLPWCKNTGYYIDLPLNISTTNPKLFITAELSGCFVGVQKIDDVIRVRHYNLKDNENLNMDDFRTYDTEQSRTHWLIPDRGNNVASFEANGIPCEHYSEYSYVRSAFMWGEYEKNQWKFFYQTPQGEVRPFAFE